MLKDLAALFNQSVAEVPTNAEVTQYNALIEQLLRQEPANSLQSVIAQLQLPAKLPTFVTHEARAQGQVF